MEKDYWQKLRDETAAKLLLEIVKIDKEKESFSILSTDTYICQAVTLATELVNELKENQVV